MQLKKGQRKVSHRFYVVILASCLRPKFNYLGGIPIGAALVLDNDQVLATGYNRRVQNGSAIHHGKHRYIKSRRE